MVNLQVAFVTVANHHDIDMNGRFRLPLDNFKFSMTHGTESPFSAHFGNLGSHFYVDFFPML